MSNLEKFAPLNNVPFNFADTHWSTMPSIYFSADPSLNQGPRFLTLFVNRLPLPAIP
jgi:hypothetical protein